MRFTQRAQRVLLFTRTEAERLQHTHIGTEHLLLGMLLDDGPVGSLLRRFELKHSMVEDQAQRIYVAQNYPNQADLQLALDLTVVLSAAAHDAHVARRKQLGSDQLLLTLLAQSACHAVEILTRLNVDGSRMRQEFQFGQGGGPPAQRLDRLKLGDFPYAPWKGPDELPQTLSENAQHVLQLAKEEATQNHQSALTSAHLLVGLLAIAGQAKRVLTYLGLEMVQVREAVGRQDESRFVQTESRLELSPDLEAVCIMALAEGRPGETAIGTGHLLLGITLQPRCAALDILAEFNISASRIQGLVIRKLQAE